MPVYLGSRMPLPFVDVGVGLDSPQRLRGAAMPAHRGKRLPHLAYDPDARMRRWLWLIWAGLTVALVFGWFAAPMRESTDAIPWLMKAPLIGLCVIWPLWRGARLILSQMREAPLAPWQGRYYAFDNLQIRVLLDEEDRLLIVASDVLDALRIKGRDRQPDRIRAIAGLDGLRTVPKMEEPVFTETGLQEWLKRSSRRDVVRFAHWLRTQVSEPHRRLRECETRN
jgi:hypothetical protein